MLFPICKYYVLRVETEDLFENTFWEKKKGAERQSDL